MKTENAKQTFAFFIGLLLSLPTFYFILISVLKYSLGSPALFDIAEPSLEQWGAKEPLGFNINGLIIFSPLTAVLLNLWSVLCIRWHQEEEQWHIEVFAAKRWSNWLVIILSSFLLLTLFVYLLGENYHS